MDDNSGKITGFYYDYQLNNPLTRVSLYANTIMNENFLKLLQESKAYNKTAEESKPVDKAEGLWSDTDKDSTGYSENPIASSILTEDFQVDIANNWGESGGDPIGGLWNNVKGVGPYLNKVGEFLKNINNKTEDYLKSKSSEDNSIGTRATNFIKDFSNNLSSVADKSSKLMQRGLSVQGTQFSYYGGSGVNFGNMSMKFTIFPEFKNKEFISVIKKIETLLPYCIGPYVPVDLKEISDSFKSSTENFAREFAHWQLPPGGFEPVIKNIDIVQKGTLKLVIGSYYAITNLVVSGCNLLFSKQMVKNPFKLPGDTDFLSPMYCDVNLMLKPATKYSYNSLLNFIQGNSTKDLRDKLAIDMKTSFENASKLIGETSDIYYV